MVRGALQGAFVGYGGVTAYAGQGYMTEALGLVLWRAFTELGLHRLEANIQPTNLAARYADQMDTGTSKWSLCSENSLLSIGSRGSVLSVGSIGCALSIGSIASVGSVLSMASFGSACSIASASSAGAVMSFRARRAVLKAASSA